MPNSKVFEGSFGQLPSEYLNRPYPVKVYWHGWESDTMTLKRSGWEVFASEQNAPFSPDVTVRLAARSPDRKLVISGSRTFSLGLFFSASQRLVDEFFHTPFELQAYQPSDVVVSYQMAPADLSSWEALRPFDAFGPIDLTGPRKRLGDFGIFSYDHTAPKDILVPAGSVGEYLDKILQLQFPDHKKPAKNAAGATPVVEARILSLAA